MADPRFISPLTILSDIGGISVDITQRVNENYDNIITQNPIEDGSPTSDHITNLPARISIEGGFSDIRISNLVGPSVTGLSLRGLAKTQFDRLLELSTRKETFRVMDGFHLFKNMQFKSLQLKKDRPGFSIFFSAELWSIIKVNTDAVRANIESALDASDRLKVAIQTQLTIGAIPVSDSLQAVGVLA